MFGTTLKNWTKGPTESPVSEADIAVDVLLRERLTAGGEAIAWLSEESIDDPARLAARRVWVIDPIDGTRAYIAGFPDWAVSAALVEDGRPIVACLYAPVAEHFFVARVKAGATCNGAPIAVTTGTTMDGARIAGPRSLLERLSAVAPPLPPCRACGRWRFASPRSRTASATSPLPAAIATIGTLRRLIFWCTKRAAH